MNPLPSPDRDGETIQTVNAIFKVIAELSEADPDSMEYERLKLRRDNLLYFLDRRMP